jgi:hypothetical protein
MEAVQAGGPGIFEVPKWDPVSQKKVRDALLVLASTLPDTSGMYGKKDEVDPVRFVIEAATGWGANPPKEAVYLNIFPKRNDGSTVYKLNVKDVPVDGFWSVRRLQCRRLFSAQSLQRLLAEQSYRPQE